MTVLSNVRDLKPSDVHTQTHFTDVKGTNRYIDFTIEEGDFIRIGIEVDGWDKRKRKTGMNPAEFRDWSLRELSMAASGWTPLRFANSLVASSPDDCRELIEIRLRLERERARALLAGGSRGEEEHRAIQSVRDTARDAERELESATDQSSVESIRAEFDRAYKKDLAELTSHLDSETEKRITVLEQERRTTHAELERELEREAEKRRRAEKENHRMKIMGAAIVAVAVLGIAAFFFGRDDGNDPGRQDAGNDPELVARCDNATPADGLSAADEGELVTARGEVVGATRFDEGTPRIYLNLGNDYPDQDLAVVIWGDDSDNWVTPPEAKYDNREVAVAGRLDTYEGALEIAANSPNDIVICP